MSHHQHFARNHRNERGDTVSNTETVTTATTAGAYEAEVHASADALEPSENGYGTAEDILASIAEVEEIVVPEWGHKRYRVRGMTGTETERYQASLVSMRNGVWTQ